MAIKTTSQGRRVVLAARPGLQVIDVIGTWRGERQDIAATARYFGIKMHLEAQQDHKRQLDQE